LVDFEQGSGTAHRFAWPHFLKCWGINADMNAEALEENMSRLEHILAHHREDFAYHLRQDSRL